MSYDALKRLAAASLAPLLNPECLVELVDPARKHVWLVAAPKSGSTWLNAILCNALGWPANSLAIGGERREQEVYFNAMLPYLEGNLFSQHQHCRLSEVTADFVRHFRVKVVLHGRNLLDSLVSFRDFAASGSITVPMAYIDSNFAAMTPERQLDFIVDMVTPWYLNFYASWSDSTVDYYWSSYEKLLENPVEAVGSILQWIDVERSEEQVQTALTRAASMPMRFNVGQTGRGKELLTPEQQARVHRLVNYYDLCPLLRWRILGI